MDFKNKTALGALVSDVSGGDIAASSHKYHKKYLNLLAPELFF